MARMRHAPSRLVAAAFVLGGMLTACSAAGDAPEESGDGVLVVAGDLYFANDDGRSDEDDLTFEAAAGPVEFVLENDGAALHNVVVEEAGDTVVAEADGGSSDTGTIDLEAGSYTLYCDVQGHRSAGMEATLTVE